MVSWLEDSEKVLVRRRLLDTLAKMRHRFCSFPRKRSELVAVAHEPLDKHACTCLPPTHSLARVGGRHPAVETVQWRRTEKLLLSGK